MTAYWIMFLIPVLFALHPVRVDDRARTLIFWLSGLTLVLFIGLRHEVGGDWDRYISVFSFHYGADLDFSKFISADYGYELIHWFSLNYLNGIYSTNLISAIFFVFGLIRFCRNMPLPWVALLVSIPFLVTVVSMGYTRQAVALGFLLYGLVDLTKRKTMKFYLSILVGVLFHKTLLVMLPIGYLYSYNKFSLMRLFFLIFLLSISLFALFSSQIQNLLYYYIEINFHHSQGAMIRVFMSFIVAIIFFIYSDKFKKKFHDEKLWFIFSTVSILLLPIVYFYSTLADRIAIYFLPLQIVVLSRIPLLIKSIHNRTIFVLMTIFLYAAVNFVWLNFGNFSRFWVPYQNLLFIS